ncbi:MAG TPA: PQQ-dependent sugar dehydrogenase [Puia sp.]|nr:PQQ-dependent sugar dehydrogenase [Puia sp.]
MIIKLLPHRISIHVILLVLVGFIFSCKQTENPSSVEKPEDNRFTEVVLTEGMDEPMEMTFLPDNRVLIAERKGGVKSVDLRTKQVKLIATIPVNTKYTSKEGVVSEAEEGLVGIVADPKFSQNNWIYLYYADPVEKRHILTRWELHGDSLYPASKKIVLEVPTQRETCCHTGGGMVFDQQGNLFITVGNNTANPPSGIASMDERPGRESWDDQRGSGNTNDLRGKILRIHPEDNGTYTIPDGNLFPKGNSKTKPEIYVMGDRNPWRISIDSKTGYIYWGEVGPDAVVDSVYGSRGYDEFNQARKPGFFGWPYFIGDNRPYRHYNFADSAYHETFNPDHPVNNSPNNTGLKELPPAQKAFIWYPYGNSDSFPLLGSSGRSATGGPVFRKADFTNAKRPFPDYYEGKWFITDFMRGWIMVVSMDENQNYKSMEPFLADKNFSSALDMKFSPEGDLYVLEYGSAWFKGNANSRLLRIEYNAGNRKPVVAASADKLAGAVPFTVQLSSKGTMDYDSYDKNALQYEWKITSGTNLIKTSADPNPGFTLDQPGEYQATLTVTDTKGEKNSKSLTLQAGNEPPAVSIDITKGNRTFYFPNQPIDYAIHVSDKEDGSVADGKIKRDMVAVNFDYVPQGFDVIDIAENHLAADNKAAFSAGLYLINANDCKTCHMPDKSSVGPSYTDVAKKYKNDAGAISKLAAKVISGGSGVWGEHAMAAHPLLSSQEAERMVRYILSVGQKQPAVNSIALSGTYIPRVPPGENGKGGYLLRAAYTDKGNGNSSPLSDDAVIALRSATLDPERADEKKSTQFLITPTKSFFMIGDGSYIGYKNLDFSGIKQLQILVQASPGSGAAGGTIEVHLDAPDGKLIGQTAMIYPKEIDYARILENMGGKGGKSGKKKITAANFDFDLFTRLMSIQSDIAVDPGLTGMHNVYFVCKNSKAPSTQILVQMIEIDFKNSLIQNKTASSK